MCVLYKTLCLLWGITGVADIIPAMDDLDSYFRVETYKDIDIYISREPTHFTTRKCTSHGLLDLFFSSDSEYNNMASWFEEKIILADNDSNSFLWLRSGSKLEKPICSYYWKGGILVHVDYSERVYAPFAWWKCCLFQSEHYYTHSKSCRQDAFYVCVKKSFEFMSPETITTTEIRDSTTTAATATATTTVTMATDSKPPLKNSPHTHQPSREPGSDTTRTRSDRTPFTPIPMTEISYQRMQHTETFTTISTATTFDSSWTPASTIKTLLFTSTPKSYFKPLTKTQQKEIRRSLELIKELTEINSSSNQTTPNSQCPCPCGRWFDPNPSPAVLANILMAIQRKLRVEKGGLSATNSKKVSANDPRPESQMIGVVAVSLAVIPFLLIGFVDLIRLYQYIYNRSG